MPFVDEVSNVDGRLRVDCCMIQDDYGGLLDEWRVWVGACFWDQHRKVCFYTSNVSIDV
jgi:hypothetical protein